MNKNKKLISNNTTHKVSQKDLIQLISTKYCKDYAEVEDIILKLDDTILSILANVDTDKNVSIKLFDGFYIDAIKTHQQMMNSNLVGKEILVSSKIKVKGRQTKMYEKRINQSRTYN